MVIIVYPIQSNLEGVPDEVQDLANTIPDTQLVGVQDSERPIFNAIDRLAKDKQEVRGLWIAGHAGVDSVELGTVSLSVPALVTYVRAIQADWVVFNTCYGDHLARRVRVETGVATLGSNVEGGEIEDRDAWRMAAALARSLVRHDGDIAMAYQEIDPRGGGQYLFRDALDAMPRGTYSQDEILDVVEEIHQIKLRLALLEQQLDLKLESIAQDVVYLRETGGGKASIPWPAIVLIILVCLAYFTALLFFIVYTGV